MSLVFKAALTKVIQIIIIKKSKVDDANICFFFHQSFVTLGLL